MQQILVVQLGVGGVGRALIAQVLASNQHWVDRHGLRFEYAALADSRSFLKGEPLLDAQTMRTVLEDKARGRYLSDEAHNGDLLPSLPETPAIIVDVTASDDSAPFLVEASRRGHAVVLANKKPLAGSMNLFSTLTAGGRTRYEATVGAGLPVISTLRSLQDTGDEVRAIMGCFSGTLGYLFSEVERDIPLSEAVRVAHIRGWTEPDPRDDLGGLDVARKALILARSLGRTLNLNEIAVEPLFSAKHARLAPAGFLEAMPELDAPIAGRMAAAKQEGNTLRYVAALDEAGVVVGVQSVPQASVLGGLRGPDNLISFTTGRYADYPLVVRGPGAGVERTAAGVLSDMLVLAREGWG